MDKPPTLQYTEPYLQQMQVKMCKTSQRSDLQKYVDAVKITEALSSGDDNRFAGKKALHLSARAQPLPTDASTVGAKSSLSSSLFSDIEMQAKPLKPPLWLSHLHHCTFFQNANSCNSYVCNYIQVNTPNYSS